MSLEEARIAMEAELWGKIKNLRRPALQDLLAFHSVLLSLPHKNPEYGTKFEHARASMCDGEYDLSSTTLTPKDVTELVGLIERAHGMKSLREDRIGMAEELWNDVKALDRPILVYLTTLYGVLPYLFGEGPEYRQRFDYLQRKLLAGEYDAKDSTFTHEQVLQGMEGTELLHDIRRPDDNKSSRP